jgi:hypothetical protein
MGVAPLDDVFATGPAVYFQPPARPRNADAHVAAITFDVTGNGLVPVARSHSELIAGGLAVFLERGPEQDANILSAIPPGSFAGIALGVTPWLIGGGTLALHHGFDPAVFAEQCRALDAPTSCRVPRSGRWPARACWASPSKRSSRCCARPNGLPPPWRGGAMRYCSTLPVSAKPVCCRRGADPTACRRR